jgi:hypothetical protein
MQFLDITFSPTRWIFVYFDMPDEEDFINQRMKIAIEVEEPLVMKNNVYSYIDYATLKLPNEVVTIWYNSSNYDLNFLPQQ